MDSKYTLHRTLNVVLIFPDLKRGREIDNTLGGLVFLNWKNVKRAKICLPLAIFDSDLHHGIIKELNW